MSLLYTGITGNSGACLQEIYVVAYVLEFLIGGFLSRPFKYLTIPPFLDPIPVAS